MDMGSEHEKTALDFPQAPPATDPAARFGRSDGEPALVDPAENNIVFTSLVSGDKDIIGLVAYSIYKQNKYDWLAAFARQQGRMPNDAEAQAYLLGEGTPRRLATYRHLAEATLDGRGVDVPGGARGGTAARALGRTPTGSPAAAWPPGRLALVGIIAVILVAIGLLWALHGAGAPKP